MRKATLLLVVAVALLAGRTQASTIITSYETCSGESFSINGPHPYFESGRVNGTRQVVGTTSARLNSLCVDQVGDPRPAPPTSLLRGTVTFNAMIRAYVRIDCFTNVPMPGRYELSLWVNGTQQIAGATKHVHRRDGSSDYLYPQGDIISGMATGLVANQDNVIELRAHMVDGGQMDIGIAFMTAQGIENNGNPATAQWTNPFSEGTATVGSTWTQVSKTATITTAGYRDVLLQAYSQIQSGTPDDRLEYEIRYKPSTSSTWSAPRRSAIRVPCGLMSGGVCLPFTNVYIEGTNILDHLYDLPNGTWHFALFARNASAHSTTIAFRGIEVMTMPYSDKKDERTLSDVKVVSTQQSVPARAQPALTVGYASTNCGYWTNIGSFQFPNEPGVDHNYVAQGYIEFLGRGTDASFTNEGDWTDETVELVLEVVGIPQFDFGHYVVSLPRGMKGFYFFSDAMLWPAEGQTVNVWIRKINKTSTANCLSYRCGYYNLDNRPATFRVGTRYFAVKAIPAGPNFYSHGNNP